MKYLPLLLASAFLTACGGSSSFGTSDDSSDSSDSTSGTTTTTTTTTEGLHTAYYSFVGNVDVALDGDEVVIEATGQPDHTSTYWDSGNASGLYVEPDTSITTVSQKSPGDIEDYTNLYTLRVPTDPSLATSTTATTLGAVGIAVSGAPIFNDQEGPADALEIGVISGFDRNGAHTGPETYHYHLEPKAITNDDSELVGVIADGFFLYGRKCYGSLDEYPTDLDASGGHTGVTQHSDGEEEYHYHIPNELYLNSYYLLFAGDYKGTPNNISN